MAAGVVTRQEKNVKVTMTATVTCGRGKRNERNYAYGKGGSDTEA